MSLQLFRSQLDNFRIPHQVVAYYGMIDHKIYRMYVASSAFPK